MKKTLWGYDVSETDELIDSLRSQNDVLSAKLINLNMELSSLKESGAANATAAKAVPTPVAMPMPEIRSSFSDEERLELAKLRSANQKLMEDNNHLNAELSGAKNDLRAVKDELDNTKSELVHTKSELIGTKSELNSGRREVKDVGQLCLKAYSDMEEMKAEVSDEMHTQIDKFSVMTNEANEKMSQALENIRSAKIQTTEYLISSYEAMLENLEVFVSQSNNIENTLSPISEVKNELVQRVNEMMYHSSSELKKWLPEEYAYSGSLEEPDKDRNLPPLLTKAIHNLRKYSSDSLKHSYIDSAPTPAAEPALTEEQSIQPVAEEVPSAEPTFNKVIGIDTKIKAKDVFGKF